MKTSVIEIVLVGGGYVSVWAYRALLKKLRKKVANGEVHITVVCPEDFHFFHGWTAESLTCIIKDENRMSALKEIFTNATIIKGRVTVLNTEERVVQITLNNGLDHQLQYDQLLLGTGSFDSAAIEGVEEYGYQVKSHDAYSTTKRTIQQLVQQASGSEPETARRLLTLTIAGCGFTGVELATNIAEFINVLKRQYPSLDEIKPTIHLVNSGERVLSALNPRFKRLISYTEKTLNNYGIKLINNSRICKVTLAGAFLCDGSFIPSAMVISTIGQSRLVLKGTESMERDPAQRLYTNASLQISGYKNIWGGGDACNIKQPGTEDACPTNALWAINHGTHVGKNIALAIKKKSLKPFAFKGLGQSASLGIGKGIGELYGLQFTGWIAWILRFIVFNYFMPLRSVMLREIGDWVYLLFHRQRRGLERQQGPTETEMPIKLKAYNINVHTLPGKRCLKIYKYK